MVQNFVTQTDVLEEDVTLVGKFRACLKVSTTGTDSDFVVRSSAGSGCGAAAAAAAAAGTDRIF